MILSFPSALTLWRRALTTEFGLAIPTTNRIEMMRIMYAARKESGDEELEKVMIMKPNNGELWLCRKEVSLD